MSTKKSRKRPTLKEQRTAKRAELQHALDSLTATSMQVKKDTKQRELLASVADGLYLELDKLVKKAPVDLASELVVESVNTLVDDVRTLAPDDLYVQRIKRFVPAGDNPEQRDVLVVLKQLRQGLDRCRERLDSQESRISEAISEARGLILALDLYLDAGETRPDKSLLNHHGESLSSVWLSGEYGDVYVVMERIEALDVASHFCDQE